MITPDMTLISLRRQKEYYLCVVSKGSYVEHSRPESLCAIPELSHFKSKSLSSSLVHIVHMYI